MATRDALVAPRIESTFWPMSAAVVAFDWAVLYEKFASSALVQPSRLKRPTIVDHALALEFQPWTKSTGACVVRGLRAASAAPSHPSAVDAPGSVMEPQAASRASDRAASGAGRRMGTRSPDGGKQMRRR